MFRHAADTHTLYSGLTKSELMHLPFLMHELHLKSLIGLSDPGVVQLSSLRACAEHLQGEIAAIEHNLKVKKEQLDEGYAGGSALWSIATSDRPWLVSDSDVEEVEMDVDGDGLPDGTSPSPVSRSSSPPTSSASEDSADSDVAVVEAERVAPAYRYSGLPVPGMPAYRDYPILAPGV